MSRRSGSGPYAPVTLPSDVAPRAGTFDPVTSLYLPVGGPARRTRAKLAAVAAQTASARCKIAMQGHSEIAGFGASVGLTSAPVLLRRALASLRFPVGTGWVPVYCNVGSGVTRDGRWSYTLGSGAWEYTGGAAGSGNMHFHLRSVTNGVKAVFASDVAGTVVEIVTTGNSAAFTYSIDGASPVTYTPSGSSVVEAVTVTGLADTRHTVVIATTSTSATYLLGAAVRSTSAVEISAFGLSGSYAGDHLPGQLFYNPYSVVDTYAPDCVVIQLDVNEAVNAVAVATFKSNVAAIIAAHRAASRDVILLNSIGPSAVAAATWTTFRQALYDLADTYAVPLFDFTHRLGGYTVANTNGAMFDTTHPNAAGYADSMQAVVGGLLAGAASGIGRPAETVTYAADNFARADGAAGSTEVGSYAWAATGGGTLSIANNRLVNTGGSAVESDSYVDDTQADGTLQLTLTSMATHSGIVFRSSATTDGFVFWRNGSTGVYQVSQRTNVSTYTALSGAIATIVGVVGDVLRVVLNGTSVKCYINGALVYSFTDSTNTTKTRHGFWRANVATAVSCDSFSHTNIAA